MLIHQPSIARVVNTIEETKEGKTGELKEEITNQVLRLHVATI
jgi:hypothetical protein